MLWIFLALYRHTNKNLIETQKTTKAKKLPWFLIFSGAGKRTRTPNMLITIQLLYRLSYAGAKIIIAYFQCEFKGWRAKIWLT